jgi:WD40 repeat protein/predicted Ser/Thr protein kinase
LADLCRRFPQQATELRRLIEQSRSVIPDAEIAEAHRETVESLAATETHRPRAGSATPLPESFGRYRIIKALGKGGMGAVYLAHDNQLDRQVALKVPHFAADDGPEVRERFLREARAAATLDHPHLCPVYDVGEHDGVLYLTMAYIDGRPLSKFIQSGKPQPPRQVAAVIRKLALALHEAHQRGVIHRDLKPSNVMINRRREPVVMDFGLARRAKSQDAALTQTGAAIGTPAYMPPEQVRGELAAMGAPCDIYSLGVILYELLAGRLPFRGYVMDVLARVLTEEPPPPSHFRPDVDRRLEAICLKAMSKRIEERYTSMAEMAAALTEYHRVSGAPEAPPAPGALPQPARQEEDLAQALFADMSLTQHLAPAQFVRREKAARQRFRWIAAIATAAVAVVVLAAVVLFVVTNRGTIKLEVLDESLSVRIDNGEIVRVQGLDRELSVRAGEHEVEIFREGERIAAERFTLYRGDEKTVIVSYQPRLALGPRTKDPTGDSPDSANTANGQSTASSDGADKGSADEQPATPTSGVAEPVAIDEIQRMEGHNNRIIDVAFTPDGTQVVSGGYDRTIRRWDVATGRELARIEELPQGVYSVGVAADGRTVVAGLARDTSLHLWDSSTNELRTVASEHQASIPKVVFSRDGSTLLTGDTGGTAIVWDGRTLRELRKLAHLPRVQTAALSDDGQIAATGSSSGEVQIWHTASGRELHRIDAHQGIVMGIAVSGDGSRVASGGPDRVVRLWDATTGELIREFDGHTDWIYSVALSGDGQRILSSSGAAIVNNRFQTSTECAIRLWNAQSGKQIGVCNGHSNHIHSVSFSPDGRLAASASSDRTVRIWRLPPTEDKESANP